MNKLILLVGIPASGKSTLAARLIGKGYVCLSADDIRHELWGEVTEQGDKERVFEIFFARMERAMSEGRDIVIDNTNINPMHRKQILERATRLSYQDVQLWILDVPLDVCLERNRARERQVPEEILTKMHGTLTGTGKPGKHEGKLVIIRSDPKTQEFRFFLPK